MHCVRPERDVSADCIYGRNEIGAAASWLEPAVSRGTYLAEIATSITEWREISPFLGLTEAEEHEILGSALNTVSRLQLIGGLCRNNCTGSRANKGKER